MINPIKINRAYKNVNDKPINKSVTLYIASNAKN